MKTSRKETIVALTSWAWIPLNLLERKLLPLDKLLTPVCAPLREGKLKYHHCQIGSANGKSERIFVLCHGLSPSAGRDCKSIARVLRVLCLPFMQIHIFCIL